MNTLKEEFQTLRNMNVRDFFRQLVVLGIVVGSALIMWKTVVLITNAESPVVVVLSGSMEPGYERGDLLFLNMWNEPIEVGDVCIYKLRGRDIPIVHRVHRVHETNVGEVLMLTKGDNNPGDDRSLYNPGQDWIQVSDLMGRSKAYLPHAGALTILMAENPWLKMVVIAILIFFVFTGKEE